MTLRGEVLCRIPRLGRGQVGSGDLQQELPEGVGTMHAGGGPSGEIGRGGTEEQVECGPDCVEMDQEAVRWARIEVWRKWQGAGAGFSV